MTRFAYKLIDVAGGWLFVCFFKRENHGNFPFVKGHLKFSLHSIQIRFWREVLH